MDGSLEPPFQTDVDFPQTSERESLNGFPFNVASSAQFSADAAPALQNLELPGVVEEDGGGENQSHKPEFFVLQCRICLSPFKMRANRDRHENKQHNTTMKRVRCWKCPEELGEVYFSSYNALRFHQKNMHPVLVHSCRDTAYKVGHTVEVNENPKVSKRNVCKICRSSFGLRQNLVRHESMGHKEKNFQCLQCPSELGEVYFSTIQGRTFHRKQVHGENLGQVGSADRNGKENIIETSPNIETCLNDGVSRTEAPSTENQVAVHESSKIPRHYICKTCFSLFRWKRDFVKHESTAHQERNFLCPECPAELGEVYFSSAQGRTRHRKDVHGRNFGRDGTDGGNGKGNGILDQSGKKRIACKWGACDLTFYRKPLLRSHVAHVHFNERGMLAKIMK